METSKRREDILQHAKALLQARGFNAFSHRDLAERTGVKSSSVHYHFPTKQDIGLALIRAYRQELSDLLDSAAALPLAQRLQAFTSPFMAAAQGGQDWCLAGMLASDYDSLEPPLRAEVQQFFQLAEQWLTVQLCLHKPDLPTTQATAQAQTAMALLEGALLLARTHQDPQRMREALRVFETLMGVNTNL